MYVVIIAIKINQPKIIINGESVLGNPAIIEPKKNTKNEIQYPIENCNPIPANSHFLSFISEFIAPIAAKQGGVNKLNIKYASPATFVSHIIIATSVSPVCKTKSSSKKLVIEKQTASVQMMQQVAMKQYL